MTKVGKQAKHLRSAAGSVRHHDIAIALAAEVGLSLSEKSTARVERDRNDASEELRGRLARLHGKSPAADWAYAPHLTGKGRSHRQVQAASADRQLPSRG